MSVNQNIITITTTSDKSTTERRIDLGKVADETKNRIIKAALMTSVAAGNGLIMAEDSDEEAEQCLVELLNSIMELERCGDVAPVTTH